MRPQEELCLRQVLRGKPHELAQVGFALAVDRSERLPHEGAEDVAIAVLEVLDVLRVLAVLRVCLAGTLRIHALTELVTAMSSARARPVSHSEMVTSPGRHLGAFPKIPFFSSTGDSRRPPRFR